MSWTNLNLDAGWTVASGYVPARVRPLTGISNAAELEGCLLYGGSANVDVPVTVEASMPAGTFDTVNYHAIGARCYNGVGGHLGTSELLITKDGTLCLVTMPTGTEMVAFGDVYPTS